MSDQLLSKFENLLNEEKWTRATINNYTIKNFEDLNKLLADFKKEDSDGELIKEIENMTSEYIKNNKHSIVALYIASILNLEKGNIDENYQYSLLKIFTDNLKWNIVEYLCNKFLEYYEDKVILRILIDAYKSLNKKDDLPLLWERLVKVDNEEADLILKLAVLKEENNQIAEAVSYYKKAINRFISSSNFIQVEEIWKKLLTFDDVGYEYFINLDKRISKHFSNDRSVELLKYLYEVYSAKEEHDVCIKILKLITEKSPNDEYARKEFVSTYRKKYREHSSLEEYIQISNIESNWRNLAEAVASFEEHIAFDKGNFVYHKTWGIGRIKDVSKSMFTIDFQNKKDHKMKLDMALTSLKVLQKNHVWILKLKNFDKFKKMVKEDPVWALKTLITSYDNRITAKNIKEELVPEILSTSSWSSWWTEARRILKTDARFGTLNNDNDVYEMRDKPLSYEEKMFNSFKAAKNFSQRLDLILDFIKNGENDSEYLEEMASYFMNFLNTTNNVDAETITSYLLIDKYKKIPAFSKLNVAYSFKDYMDNVENPITIFQDIPLSDFKKDYLVKIKHTFKNWDSIFTDLFYTSPSKYLLEELLTKGNDFVEKIVRNLIASYKEYREAFFLVFSTFLTKEKAAEMKIDYDNLIFSLIHLIELTGKDITIKKDITQNKKLSNQIKDFLFKNNFLTDYIKDSNEDFCQRLFTISSKLEYIDTQSTVDIQEAINKKYPDIIEKENLELKYDDGLSKRSIIDKLIITEKSLKGMQEELVHIKDVEIPENAKNIGIAREKGDLRENADYKAGKEREVYLQNRLNKLLTDISRARVVKKSDVTGEFVTFGTKITLLDKIANKDTEFIILGPMESNTEKNIISYQSPLGLNLLDKKVNEEIKFVLNDKNYDFILKKIEIYNF